ncbi:MAG: hypothetical protein GAK28_00933 [Luteibacter sp.]|uniref:YXWGXW repeat-containing protein n=1 Tax=Luteibacter sp. TaxID=1886636 RepID=UPI001381B083|nr:YXWGXW repeat-containing protein [Luteibacter sp.]KAF1008512.1 MAG: hypothetical protein GAK28_00933 [Luteibacter sp.]
MKRFTRTLAIATALGLAVGAASFAPLATAREVIVTTVRVAPPPPRYEVVPGPRVGYVWAPGYWNWYGGRYVWIGGRWYAGRPGYVYHPPVWRPYGGGWRIERETWVRGPRWHR